mmetsp:Transcript_11154/g.16470  ORF Transcript_11154/g.16470 Transcript_11154/m.16470 type:complete len:228 (+) Transcript_11154:507-1190(+)
MSALLKWNCPSFSTVFSSLFGLCGDSLSIGSSFFSCISSSERGKFSSSSSSFSSSDGKFCKSASSLTSEKSVNGSSEDSSSLLIKKLSDMVDDISFGGKSSSSSGGKSSSSSGGKSSSSSGGKSSSSGGKSSSSSSSVINKSSSIDSSSSSGGKSSSSSLLSSAPCWCCSINSLNCSTKCSYLFFAASIVCWIIISCSFIVRSASFVDVSSNRLLVSAAFNFSNSVW